MIRELVVLSGKGGTGKTSLTAAFAALASDAVFADCDVDASNLPLLLSPTPSRTGLFHGGSEATIRPGDCSSCGLCAELCRFGAIRMLDGEYRIAGCEGCGVCVEFCPSGAIDWNPSTTGSWTTSSTPFGPLAHARLRPGAENSGKLASLVRTKARELAEAAGSGLILVDGPPGIGCAAIATLAGASGAVLVAEPTPSGLHDLERILDLAGHFRVPARVVVNKWDLNPELAGIVERTARDKGCLPAGRLRYSTDFTTAQQEALPVNIRFPESVAAREIEGIWKEIETWSME